MANCNSCRHYKAFPNNVPCSRCYAEHRFQRMTEGQCKRERAYQASVDGYRRNHPQLEMVSETAIEEQTAPAEQPKAQKQGKKPNASASPSKPKWAKPKDTDKAQGANSNGKPARQ